MQISMRPQNQSLISHCHGRNIIYYSSIATTFCLIGLTMIMICQQEKLIFASFLPTYLELILSTTTLKWQTVLLKNVSNTSNFAKTCADK